MHYSHHNVRGSKKANTIGQLLNQAREMGLKTFEIFYTPGFHSTIQLEKLVCWQSDSATYWVNRLDRVQGTKEALAIEMKRIKDYKYQKI